MQAAPAIPCPEGQLRDAETDFRTASPSYVRNRYRMASCVMVPAATLMR